MNTRHTKPNAQDLMVKAMHSQQDWFKALFKKRPGRKPATTDPSRVNSYQRPWGYYL